MLLDTALDGNMHHSLRHAAAHSYHQHPLRERDLTDVIEETCVPLNFLCIQSFTGSIILVHTTCHVIQGQLQLLLG